METTLKDRRALITGASSGLGAEFARQLAARGCHLVLVARREQALTSLAETLKRDYRIEAEVISQDLSTADAAEQLFQQVQARALTVDILINNAGFGLHGEFMSQDHGALRKMLQLNMVTLTELTRLFAEPMVERGHGYLVQVGSVASFQPGPLYGAYSASKAYVLSLGDALNFELRNTGVSCTVVCPGVTATEFLDSAGQASRTSFYQRLFMMQPAAVVSAGINAMLRRRSHVVTGWLNKIQVLALRLVSRSFAARAAWWGMSLDEKA